MPDFIPLTTPDGGKVWLAPKGVVRIKSPDTRHARGSRAVLDLGGREQAVRETPDEVLALMRGDNV